MLCAKSYWHLSRTLASQAGMTHDWLKSQGLLSVRRLTEPYLNLILDARYEKVRLEGVIQSQAAHVHSLRNALDPLPRKADDDCLQELSGLYDRRDLKAAQQDLPAWLKRGRAAIRSSPTGSRSASARP